MSTRLTQSAVNGLRERHPPGAQVYDAEVPGLRVVVGGRSASYKLVGRINDGSERYVSIIIGRTDELPLKEARDRARELRLMMRRGQDPRVAKRGVPTLRSAWERYERTRGLSLRPKTVVWYRRQVFGGLKPLLDVPMDRIDRATVRDLHDRVTLRGHPIAANGMMRAFKALWNDAARSFDLPPNPVSRGVRLNKESARDWAVGPDELPALWRALDAMPDRIEAACWLTMLTTGLRKGDARSIEWANIDADGVLLVPSPKGGPDRSFKTPLPRLLLQELERVRQETSHMRSRFVFTTQIGASGHIADLRRSEQFPYAPHQMRHTYRTVALEAGVDFQTITLLMNHRPGGVSWGYVTRAHLVGPMRTHQERIVEALLSYR
ncbi:MAG: tyrosine-type recombinase/integrase [Hyphomicrobiaceae bacterium]